MSNNIYDILKKFNNLDSVKNMLTEGKTVCKDCGKAKCECVTESKGSKPDFLDIDKDGDKKEPMKSAAKDKGAIAEAVARVEQNLAEKYQGFKKSVAEGVKPKGTISPTDSGEEYRAAPGYRVKAEFEPGSTGKPKMDFVKSEPEQTGQGAKPVDQTKPVNKKEVDESGLQAYLGKKKYGEQGMKALQKAGRNGASKEKMAMIRAKHDKMDEGEYNEDMLSPGQKKIARMSPPPNKIDANDLAALRAGKKKKSEGNAFSGAVAKAKATGQDEFEVGGKEYKVQEGFPTVDDAKKRMDAKSGKTAHGTKTVTKTGVKHERNYDADEPTGERGRPKKDKFAK